MRILLIEDDITVARSIELSLATEGIILDVSILGEEGLEFIKMYRYDLIILDLMLPDLNGYDVLKKIRELQLSVPIIILSGLLNTEDKVRGLEYGADDYLTKPFSKKELLARIKAIIRRSRGHFDALFKTGELSIDLNTHSSYMGTRLIPFTAKEQILLEALAIRKGNVVSKEFLLGQIYSPMDEPELKIIDVFVCKMRKKLNQYSNGQNYIETIWGRGYVLKDPEELSNNLEEKYVINQ